LNKTLTKWESLQWLRERFLSPSTSSHTNDYWEERPELLALYDHSFAARIGWKWDSVLAEIKAKNWAPPESYVLVDWGCGTGRASRSFLESFGDRPPEEIYLHDHSARALAFATEKLKPLGIPLHSALPASTGSQKMVLLVSHVLSELPSRSRERLFHWTQFADAVIWIEPGTPDSSQKLIQLREQSREKFVVVAPCPHQAVCPLKENPKDWCHFFADIPSMVHQSAEWREFSEALNIDLRSLPVSYLCLQKGITAEQKKGGRLIGRPRVYKGYLTGLICRESTAVEEKFLKRDKTGPFRELKEGGFRLAIPDNKP